MNWLTIRTKLYAIGAAIVALLGLILRNRYLAGKAKRADHRADVAEAGIERKVETEKREQEIDLQTADKQAAADKDIEDGKVPDHLANPRRR